MPLSKIDSDSLTAPLTVPAGSAAAPAITTTGDTNTGIFFPAADTIAFATAGTEAMRIDSSGNLTIKDKIQFGTDAQTNIQAGGTSDVDLIVSADTLLRFETATNERMRIDSSGNVGIGTTDTGGKLLIAKATVPTTYSKNTAYLQVGAGEETLNGFHLITFGYTTSASTFQPAFIGYTETNNSGSSTGALIFGTRTAVSDTTPAERMRILSSGTLLFSGESGGTTAEATGTITTYANGSAPYVVHNIDGQSSGFTFNIFKRLGTGVGNIAYNGTGVTFTTTSDYRLKENIRPATNALDMVAKLKPRLFNWKETGEEELGFIAHELQEEFPNAVAGEKDAVETYLDDEGNEQTRIKPQGIDTSFLVATLTAAIQELKAIVDAQGAEIAALKGKP